MGMMLWNWRFGRGYICCSLFLSSVLMCSVYAQNPQPTPTSSTYPCTTEGVNAEPIPTTIPAVKVPCLDDDVLTSQPRLDLQSCKNVLSTARPTPQASNSAPGIVQGSVGLISGLKDYYSNYLYCFYKGYYLNPQSENTSTFNKCEQGFPTSLDSMRTVCNLRDGEQDNNFLGSPCGNTYNRDGVWEQTQTRGLHIQALKFFYDQTINTEVLKEHRLKIHAKCNPIAIDYYTTNSVAQRLSGCLTPGMQVLPPPIANGTIDLCAADPAKVVNASFASSADKEATLAALQIIPKTSACYIGISRQNRIWLFSSLIKCEVDARIEEFYLTYAKSATEQFNSIITNCVNIATSHGNDVGKANSSESDGKAAGNAKFNSCYADAVKGFFQGLVQQYIPTQFDCSGSGEKSFPCPKPLSSQPQSKTDSDPLSALGFLVGSIRFWRREKKGGTENQPQESGENLTLKPWKIFGFLLMNLAFLYVSQNVVLGCGCGGSGDAPPPIMTVCCYDGMTAKKDTNGELIPDFDAIGKLAADEKGVSGATKVSNIQYCCDSDIQYTKYNETATSTVSDALRCGTQCTACVPAKNAALAAASAKGANSGATQTLSGGSGAGVLPEPSSTPTITGDSYGAAAGGTETPAPSGDGKPGAAPQGQTGSKAEAGSFGSGGGSGGGGGGGSGSGSFSADSGTTAPGAGQGQRSAARGGGNSSSSTYSSGGGGSDGGSRGGSGFSADSRMRVDGSGGTVGSVSFGSDGAIGGSGVNVNPMVGDDPADYFTRLGLDVDLFKAIHKVYEQKEVDWVESKSSKPPGAK